jgi:hypothetical protein
MDPQSDSLSICRATEQVAVQSDQPEPKLSQAVTLLVKGVIVLVNPKEEPKDTKSG